MNNIMFIISNMLSKPVGYFEFANIILSCICFKLIIHFKTSIYRERERD